MHRPLNLLTIILSICILGCKQAGREEQSDVLKTVSKSEISIVQTYIAKADKFNYLIQSAGKIKAFNEQVVLAENAGLVIQCNLRNSTTVTAGLPLLKLDTKSIQLKIEKTKENIFNNKLNYQSDLLSQESLLKEKSKGVKDTVFRKLKANAGLTDSELELKDLQLELSKATIVAPFSGMLANVKVQNGQYIRAGDELFTIYTNSDLYLEAKILETDIGSVKIGQLSEVMPVSGSLKYRARVAEINPLVDENGLIIVKLKLTDTHGLLPGMNAMATIFVPEQESLIVPKQAVVMRSDKAVVFTLEDGLAKWNYVIVGRDNGKEVEIKDGLKPGQKVIISNNLQLAHDAPVKEQK